MARLVTFGCSFTNGDGLPDVYPVTEEVSGISKFGWSFLLGEMLGLEVVNNAVSGAGNLEILIKILKSDLTKDDTCVVMWSAFDRHDQYISGIDFEFGRRQSLEVFLRKNNIDDPIWIINNKNKNWLTIHHASCHLANLGVKFYSLLGIVNPNPITYPIPKPLDIPNFIEDIKPIDWIVDRGLDSDEQGGGHPGLESQRLLATLLYDRML